MSKICRPTPFIHHAQFHACFSCCQSRVISLCLCSCSYKVSHYLAGPNNNPCYVHCDGLLICGSFSVTETNGCVERGKAKGENILKLTIAQTSGQAAGQWRVPGSPPGWLDVCCLSFTCTVPQVSYLYCIYSMKAEGQKTSFKKNEKQKHYIIVWTTATGDINHPWFGCPNCKGTRAHWLDLPEFLI